MRIQSEEREGRQVFVVSGRLDATTAHIFEQECKDAVPDYATVVIVDLSQLEYVSSAGLRVILAMQQGAKAKGYALAFCGVQGMVMEIFKVSYFDRILLLYDSLEEALSA